MAGNLIVMTEFIIKKVILPPPWPRVVVADILRATMNLDIIMYGS